MSECNGFTCPGAGRGGCRALCEARPGHTAGHSWFQQGLAMRLVVSV